MNITKLKAAERRFIERYPGGFSNPLMLELVKKHKVEKMKQMAQDSFAMRQFECAGEIVESMIKIASQSTLVSIFEKPKFRDSVRSMSDSEKQHLSHGLRNFCMGISRLVLR